jgi:hypothetical protein
MALQAMWIHGQALIPEITADETGNLNVAIVSAGSAEGSTYQGNAGISTWFHFPIPTPVIQNNVRARLIKGFVLFRSDAGVLLTHVDIWDGAKKLGDFSPPSGISGIHDGKSGLGDLLANVTMWELRDQPQVFWGVCLSAQVQFEVAGTITFTTAGADFVV